MVTFNDEADTWGLNFSRSVVRKNEVIAWVTRNRQYNPAASGTATGIEGLRQGDDVLHRHPRPPLFAGSYGSAEADPEDREHPLERAAAALAPLRVPAMRKDFLLDPYQVSEARLAGAGGVLAIARMLDDAGVDVLNIGAISTDMLYFAVVNYRCDGGLAITASHNPPQDNGYKVYWDNAAQIVPPHDAAIAAQIDRVDPTDVDVVAADHELISREPQLLDPLPQQLDCPVNQKAAAGP